MTARLHHEFGPIYNSDSKILILGSFPSVRSRAQQFYYAHPQNRFWKIIASLCDSPVPETVADKKKLILNNGFALWDVIESCEITGSSDSSIKNARVNDLGIIIAAAHIRTIAVNGSAAYDLYAKYDEPSLCIPAVKLPSSSPANAAWSLERLTSEWEKLLDITAPVISSQTQVSNQ